MWSEGESNPHGRMYSPAWAPALAPDGSPKPLARYSFSRSRAKGFLLYAPIDGDSKIKWGQPLFSYYPP